MGEVSTIKSELQTDFGLEHTRDTRHTANVRIAHLASRAANKLKQQHGKVRSRRARGGEASMKSRERESARTFWGKVGISAE